MEKSQNIGTKNAFSPIIFKNTISTVQTTTFINTTVLVKAYMMLQWFWKPIQAHHISSDTSSS